MPLFLFLAVSAEVRIKLEGLAIAAGFPNMLSCIKKSVMRLSLHGFLSESPTLLSEGPVESFADFNSPIADMIFLLGPKAVIPNLSRSCKRKPCEKRPSFDSLPCENAPQGCVSAKRRTYSYASQQPAIWIQTSSWSHGRVSQSTSSLTKRWKYFESLSSFSHCSTGAISESATVSSCSYFQILEVLESFIRQTKYKITDTQGWMQEALIPVCHYRACPSRHWYVPPVR